MADNGSVKPRALLGLSFFVLAPLAACSSSSSSGFSKSDAGDGGGSGFAAAAAAVASGYCARSQDCAPSFVTGVLGDVPTCVSTLTNTLLRAATAPGVKQTPDQLTACAAALPKMSCGDFLARRTVDACKPVAGSLADGTACGADAQCSGTRCIVALNHACGTCGSHAAAGASCGVDDDCDVGLRCAAGKCVAYGDEKATCDATHPCRPDLGCVAGACGTPSPVGAPCTTAEQCDAAHGSFCNPKSKVCEVANVAGPGGPCGFVAGHLATCSGPSGFCANVSATTFAGTCKAPAAAGAACDTAAGPLCGSGAVCVCTSATDGGGCTGTCTVPDPTACH
jgi:hypothetical protein